MIKEEVDESKKEKSILLTLSAYFTNWAQHTKENKLSNKVRKFRYFRELKKLLAMKNKRALSEMLNLTTDKIKDIDRVSTDFCELKKYTIHSLIAELREDLGEVENKKENMTTAITKIKSSKKDQHQ